MATDTTGAVRVEMECVGDFVITYDLPDFDDPVIAAMEAKRLADMAAFMAGSVRERRVGRKHRHALASQADALAKEPTP